MKKLLSTYQKGSLSLKNRIVMAPMTRSRAIENIPNDLMAKYYGQRSTAGLIITEGTAPSPEALGYPRIPGIYNEEQIAGWQKITDRVHQSDAKIFVQLMHVGRIGHSENLRGTKKLLGASDKIAAGQIHTDSLGKQDHSRPTAISTQQLPSIIAQFVSAAENAMKAGFDGVEIHAANGYLLEQFLNPHVNNRTDSYGGSIENRARFTLDVVAAIVDQIGPEKVGIRFSPFSTLGDLQPYDEKEVEQTYGYLSRVLDTFGIAYIHINTNPDIPDQLLTAIRSDFKGTLILCSNMTPESGEAKINAGITDLIAFGRSFIANPDLPERIRIGQPFNEMDYATAYSAGPGGYTDYSNYTSVE